MESIVIFIFLFLWKYQKTHNNNVGKTIAFSCNCKAGYNGTNCENNIDDCSPNPCFNNGICNDGINCKFGFFFSIITSNE